MSSPFDADVESFSLVLNLLQVKRNNRCIDCRDLEFDTQEVEIPVTDERTPDQGLAGDTPRIIRDSPK